jgi:chemotaxis regulatin CheY-phosphate phosphatase CheZ
MTDVEPQTDAEKIEWLWNRLDARNMEVASLRLSVTNLENMLEEAKQETLNVRQQAMQMAQELSQMALELNAARQSAANAVREYVAATEG